MAPDGPANQSLTELASLHAIGQESALAFNPHLHNVTANQQLIYGQLMPGLAMLSVLANLLIFSALFHKNRTKGVSSLSLILQFLAFYDVMVSLMSLWVYCLPTLLKANEHLWPEYLYSIHPRLAPFLFPVLHMAITGCDYLNLAAAVERYIALDRHYRQEKSPHHGCRPNKTIFYVAAISCFTILFNVPLFLERETVEVAQAGKWNAIGLAGDLNFDDLAGNLNASLVAGDLNLSAFAQGDADIPTEHISSRFPLLSAEATPLRRDALYIKLYRLMAEFLIFKVTPFLSFLVLFLSLKDRIHFYTQKHVIRTLSVEQYFEVLDSRIILGINALFYLTSTAPFYVSFCHIILAHVPDGLVRVANLLLVANSTMKFFVYVALSRDFRLSLHELFVPGKRRVNYDDDEGDEHWMADEDKNRLFLGHARVVTFVQADTAGGRNKNVCVEG